MNYLLALVFTFSLTGFSKQKEPMTLSEYCLSVVDNRAASGRYSVDVVCEATHYDYISPIGLITPTIAEVEAKLTVEMKNLSSSLVGRAGRVPRLGIYKLNAHTSDFSANYCVLTTTDIPSGGTLDCGDDDIEPFFCSSVNIIRAVLERTDYIKVATISRIKNWKVNRPQMEIYRKPIRQMRR